jgi:hypothetical protein
VKPHWRKPALGWHPVSGAVLTWGVYLLVALWTGSKVEPKVEIMFPLFVSMFIPLPRHVFARFGPTESTEWLMGMGLDRRELTLRYAIDLAWWSGVHALGAFLLFLTAPRFDLFRQAGWTRAEELARLTLGVFLVQLTARSAFAMVAHLDRSTLVTPRMRDEFAGVKTSFWITFGWFLLALLGLIVVVAGPIGLVAATGSFFWLAVPAALYLRLAYAMAASSEFVRKAAPVDDWGAPLPPPTAPPAREYFVGLHPDHAAAAPLRGLLWDGLGRGMKVVLLVLLLSLGASASWWAVSSPDDREKPGICAGIALALFPVIFALFGQRVFAWNRSEDAIEYLFVRGVTLRTLDRIRMAWGLLATGVVMGGMVLFHEAVEVRKGWYLPLWSIACYMGAGLLFEGNRRTMPRALWRCRTFAELGTLIRATGLVFFFILSGMVRETLAIRLPLGLGVALLVCAALVWIRSAVPLYLRR